jgi:hypothetical protein
MGGSWFLLSGVPLRSGVLSHSFPSADTLTGFFQILKRYSDNSIDDDYDCYDGNRLIILITTASDVFKNLGGTSRP